MDLTPLFKERSDYLPEFILFPNEIVSLLDKHIIGQEKAKKVLGIALFLRSLRMLQRQGTILLHAPLEKHNIIMVGPTGCGKTALMRAIAETLDILVTITDVSGITSAGYVGGDIDDIINLHLHNAHHRVEQRAKGYETMSQMKQELEIETKFGVVYLDEFDKCRKDIGGYGKDINGQSVQQELLKLLEGEEISYRNDRQKGELKTFDCSETLFICGGAYVGLDKIVLERLNKKVGIGFAHEGTRQMEADVNILDHLTNEDMEKYGFLPEVLGRLTTCAVLKELTIDNLVQIITNGNNGLIHEYTSYFDLFDVQIEFDEFAIKEIATVVKDNKVGARGLRSVILKIVQEYQYNIQAIAPKQKLLVTKEDVRNSL